MLTTAPTLAPAVLRVNAERNPGPVRTDHLAADLASATGTSARPVRGCCAPRTLPCAGGRAAQAWCAWDDGHGRTGFPDAMAPAPDLYRGAP